MARFTVLIRDISGFCEYSIRDSPSKEELIKELKDEYLHEELGREEDIDDIFVIEGVDHEVDISEWGHDFEKYRERIDALSSISDEPIETEEDEYNFYLKKVKELGDKLGKNSDPSVSPSKPHKKKISRRAK